MKKIWMKLNVLRNIVAYIMYLTSKDKSVINYDIKRWIEILDIDSKSDYYSLSYLLLFYKEFRNLFYHRIKKDKPIISRVFLLFFPTMETLILATPEIGKGLFLQHGISTIVAAKSIGEDCWINQQVTIGHSNKTDAPILGNNVRITAGAKVIGNVKLNDNCIVGANAVVVKDVPRNAVVGGVPAKIIKYV